MKSFLTKTLNKSNDIPFSKILNSFSDVLSNLSLKADKNIDTYGITEISNPQNEPVLRKIAGIKISWLTSQEIENMATVNVKSTKQTGPGSVYDSMMGTISNHEICPICSLTWKDCSGHPGVIKLPFPLPHPMVLSQIADILTCFCEWCHRLVLTVDKMKLFKILRYKNVNRFKAVVDVIKKKVVRCHHCKKPHSKCINIEDKFVREYKKSGKTEKNPFPYESVVKSLVNIRDGDAKLIGLDDPLSHPRNLVLFNLSVAPPCTRPYVESNGNVMHDDLSTKYNEIIKCCNKLEQDNLEKIDKMKIVDSLMFHIRTFMDNSKQQAKDLGGRRSLRAIKQRFGGKGGIVRSNMQGKRNINCIRSVASPNPDLYVGHVGIPRELANKITFPIRVTSHNIKDCSRILEQGEALYIKRGDGTLDVRFALWTPGFKLKYNDIVIRQGKKIIPSSLKKFQLHEGDSVLRNEEHELPDGTFEKKTKLIKNVEGPTPKKFQLQLGDIVERKIKDGDYVIINRQPSLHEPSLKALKVELHDNYTIQTELSTTQSYGLDYDGDEQNVFCGASYASLAEMETLMSTEGQFISAANSVPMSSVKQDNILTGYHLTLGRVPISRALYYNTACILDQLDLPTILSKMDHIRHINKREGLTGTDDQLLYSGHGLFSLLLPRDFHLDFTNNISPDGKQVIIRAGVIIAGTIDKNALHRIIHLLYKDYGPKLGCYFITYWQRFTNYLVCRIGFSVGIADCEPSSTMRELMNKQLINAFKQAEFISRQGLDPEQAESKILNILNCVTNENEKIVRNNIDKTNNMMKMIISGAKGSFHNFVSSAASVGQQNLSGKRPIKDCGGRCLPCFPPEDMLIEEDEVDENSLKQKYVANGFVTSSFYDGLSAPEFFYIATAGREGLIDISIKTGPSGYMSKRLLKLMEDLRISYTGAVCNSRGTVIDFAYGDDNYSSTELIKTEKDGLQVVDLEHIVNTLNYQEELRRNTIK